jgi:predicted RNA-binding Zn-ribbon protein involved in translation (DUF1610 family)
MNKKFNCPACLAIINHVDFNPCGNATQEVTVDEKLIVTYKNILSNDGYDLFECPECGKVIAQSEEELLEVIKENLVEE